MSTAAANIRTDTDSSAYNLLSQQLEAAHVKLMKARTRASAVHSARTCYLFRMEALISANGGREYYISQYDELVELTRELDAAVEQAERTYDRLTRRMTNYFNGPARRR